MTKFLVVFCILLVVTLGASGGILTQCPAVGADTGCELLITVTSVNGAGAATAFTVTTASAPTQGAFDGVEDTLIGITNSASGALKSIFLTGGAGSGAFSFDGDGACTGTYTPTPTAAQCGGAFTSSDPASYGSAGATFGTFGPDSGTVLTGGAAGLASGASTWFDLEGRITAVQLGAPEPASFVLLGMGFSALLGVRLRRKFGK